jgi:hypothetical protein
MEHINDDMDELFRRAAEGYPLNTDSTDWDAVTKKLAAANPVGEKSVTKNKNYKHLLWLLLLMPLTWLYNSMGKSEKEHSSGALSKNVVDRNNPHTSQHEIVKSKSKHVKPIGTAPNNFLASVNHSGDQNKIIRKANSNITATRGTLVISDRLTLLIKHLPSEVGDKKENDYVIDAGDKKNKVDIVERENETTSNILNADGDQDKKESVQFDTVTNNQERKIKADHKKIRKQNDHGLYAGIFISPDLSTIKFQKIKNIGLSKGFLIGYRINKNISLESGIGWDKKNYYSEGKYFNTKNIRLPNNAKIINVEGVCKMIEIPLTIIYNLGNSNFSTAAGLSGYFMKSETYDYAVERNGQQYPRSATYKNSSNNLLAVANFSVGYNKVLRKKITFRIEPYVKIPLKGFGIGNLPIMSIGLKLGFIKKLSKY